MKKTMTLNLTPAEMEALEQLAAKKDLSKTAVIRQALRLYHTVDIRLEEGDKMFFEGPLEDKKIEVMVL
jgi:predicted transcriptional regulator